MEMSWITAISQLYSQIINLFGNAILKLIHIRFFDLLTRCQYILTPLVDRKSLFFLNPNFLAVVVQPGLCRAWSETPKTGFFATRLIYQTDINAYNANYQNCFRKLRNHHFHFKVLFFLYRGLGLFYKSSSKTSSRHRTILRVGRLHT